MTGKVIVTGRRGPTATPDAPTPTVTVTPTPTPPTGPAIVAKDGGAEPYWFQDASSTDPARQQRHDPGGRDGQLQLPGRRRPSTTSCSRAPRRSRRASRRPGTVYPAPVPPLPAFVRPAGLVGRLHVHRRPAPTRSCARRIRTMTGTVVVQSTTRARDDDQQRPGRTDEPDVGELHVLVQPAGGDVRVPAGHTGGQRHLRRVHVAGGVHDDHERQLHVQRPSGAGRDA